jgi:hypothetical protein
VVVVVVVAGGWVVVVVGDAAIVVVGVESLVTSVVVVTGTVVVVTVVDGSTTDVVDVVSLAVDGVSSMTDPGTSAASATADGEPKAVGASVTWERTEPTAAAATMMATIVAPSHASVNPIPRFI